VVFEDLHWDELLLKKLPVVDHFGIAQRVFEIKPSDIERWHDDPPFVLGFNDLTNQKRRTGPLLHKREIVHMRLVLVVLQVSLSGSAQHCAKVWA
jgi:hypothetical protein